MCCNVLYPRTGRLYRRAVALVVTQRTGSCVCSVPRLTCSNAHKYIGEALVHSILVPVGALSCEWFAAIAVDTASFVPLILSLPSSVHHPQAELRRVKRTHKIWSQQWELQEKLATVCRRVVVVNGHCGSMAPDAQSAPHLQQNRLQRQSRPPRWSAGCMTCCHSAFSVLCMGIFWSLRRAGWCYV
jgi:hypothetical protein